MTDAPRAIEPNITSNRSNVSSRLVVLGPSFKSTSREHKLSTIRLGTAPPNSGCTWRVPSCCSFLAAVVMDHGRGLVVCRPLVV